MRIIIIKRILSIFLFSLFFVACTTIKKEESKRFFSQENLVWERFEIKNITFKANSDINFSGTSLSAVIKGKIAQKDSASFTIFGPFGITVAKAFINKDTIIFFDSYNNRYLVANHNYLVESKNILIAKYVNLIKKVYDLIRNEYPKPSKKELIEENEDFIAFNVKTKMSNDRIDFNKKSNLITKISSFGNNKEEYSVNYSEFDNFENILFPKIIEFKNKTNNIELKMEFSELKFNMNYDEIPFNFSIPKNAEKINF